MKPRIYKRLGVWYCMPEGGYWADAGIGYTPKKAYEDWLAQSMRPAGVAVPGVGA